MSRLFIAPIVEGKGEVEAETQFRVAEEMQRQRQPHYPLLYSVQGFQYCDLLLARPERAAWQVCVGGPGSMLERPLIESCHAVALRAARTLDISARDQVPLEIALDHLTLGRVALYETILKSRWSRREAARFRSAEIQSLLTSFPAIATARRELVAAADGLRNAGTTHHVPRPLLTRAWLRFLTGAGTGHKSAQADLDEAWEIAERGPMRLHMADIHLYRARLFFREKPYPWESPAADLSVAEKLINECGYHRRDEELADAKRAILGGGA